MNFVQFNLAQGPLVVVEVKVRVWLFQLFISSGVALSLVWSSSGHFKSVCVLKIDKNAVLVYFDVR